MKFKAKWIWKKQRNYNLYNQTVIAKKIFNVNNFKSADIYITADSFYRLYINQIWVNDGPAKGWPNHFPYDKIDVSSYLKKGSNEIKVEARYNGIGNLRSTPQQAGLLVQLDIKLNTGELKQIISDKSWKVASAKQWISNTPKLCLTRGPWECYDAQLENSGRFTNAAELFEANAGPWKGLNQRSTSLLTKIPFSFKRFLEANIVAKKTDLNFCVCGPRLVFPGLVECNLHTHVPFGMATIINVKKKCNLEIISESWRNEHFKVAIDGKHNSGGKYNLSPGKHLVLAFNRSTFGHDKDTTLRFVNPPKLKLENPLDSSCENPWCFIPFNEFAFVESDMNWHGWLESNPEIKDKLDNYIKQTNLLLKKAKDKKTFLELCEKKSKKLSYEKMFAKDSFWKFVHRNVTANGSKFVENPEGLIHDNDELTIVNPSQTGNLELVYDLGEQNWGYFKLDLISEAGVQIDIFGIEHKDKDGNLQFTIENRNGVSYTTKHGSNRFISHERRSSRYIFITIRNQTKPIKIRNISLMESTYPVTHVGSFACSDERLSKIWEISERTLKLCMDDTYVDCPAFEQVFWVGDARNEALFGFYAFGAVDIAKRCLEIVAESLERYPMAACQAPNNWDSIIPVWSFLWGIAVWDYYWFTGDKTTVKQMWNPVIKNLKAAEKYINENDLFSAPLWNLFDWADIDQEHETVFHNSMFMVGAIDAALKCAQLLGDSATEKWLKKVRKRLSDGVNKFWDSDIKSYPDSIHEDGKISQSTSQHTNFLAILYDIVEKKNYKYAKNNTANPPDGMINVGSPFAILYLFEAMEKIGLEENIIDSIYKNYLPMLEDEATTVWEVFPGSSASLTDRGGFPSRSHCHAWSSAPLYFLNRIILGVKQTSVAGKTVEISPLLINGISWARGTVASANGPINASWRLDGKILNVNYSGPEGTKISFVSNDSHKGIKIVLT